MKRLLKAVRVVVLMGDVGELHHFGWVAALTVFIVGAILKSNLPDATWLPVAGALLAGLAVGWMAYRVELRGRSST